MKNLIALFSAKKVKVKIEELNFDVLQQNDLSMIRGGGQPYVAEHNIILAD
jgi:hypothetical protein